MELNITRGDSALEYCSNAKGFVGIKLKKGTIVDSIFHVWLIENPKETALVRVGSVLNVPEIGIVNESICKKLMLESFVEAR